MSKHDLDALTERIEPKGKLHQEIRVWRTNSGRFMAEYKIGTVKWQVPTSGNTAEEAMRNAKRWLKAPIYGAKP